MNTATKPVSVSSVTASPVRTARFATSRATPPRLPASAEPSAGIRGQKTSTPTSPVPASTATRTNVACHPYAWPTSEPTGSPITVARAKPANTRATAAVWRSGAAAAIATCEATAMNSACATAEPSRATSSTP